MQFTTGGGFNAATVAAHGGRLPFVQKVYGLFLAGILVSVLAAGALFATPTVQTEIGPVPQGVIAAHNSGGLVFLLFFGLFFLTSFVRRMPVVNVLSLFAFTAVSGIMIAPRLFIAMHTAPGSLPLAGALTTIMFGGLSAYAMLSRRDFNFLGAGLCVALLGLIVGGFLNALCFHSPWAYMMMAWGAVVVFSGFVLYDTQRILTRLRDDEYVLGAIELYLDFINLFLALLRILGGNRR